MDSSNIDETKNFENFDGRELYDLIQDKGRRRIYTLKGDVDKIPPSGKGTEIFVRNLPPNFFENELFPLFSKVGIIYRITLFLDSAGQNRGFAFIRYFSEEEAQSAISTLHNSIVRLDAKISVRSAIDNRRLFMKNIPKDKSMHEIESELMKCVEGVVNIILLSDPYKPGRNRGFVFVEFSSYKQAADARELLNSENLTLWGHTIPVHWAYPEPNLSPKVAQEVGF